LVASLVIKEMIEATLGQKPARVAPMPSPRQDLLWEADHLDEICRSCFRDEVRTASFTPRPSSYPRGQAWPQ